MTIVITSAIRTPIGNFQGYLSNHSATDLGAHAIRGAVDAANIPYADINAVIMGCVLPAGLRQAPARQASIGAGLPPSAGATTINKVCGSGMQAVMLSHDQIIAGTHNIMVAGGMENMTNAPYLLPGARKGYRLGHKKVMDHMFFDGLEDAFHKGELMGTFAELCAEHYHFTREQQDAYAIESVKRAQHASNNGAFENEIITIDDIIADEGPLTARPEKIPRLRSVFKDNGTVTAANASSISDGAAALVLMTQEEAEKRNTPILATIKAHATHAHDSAWFTTAPIKAIEAVLEKAGWKKENVDLFEINEAFAVVVMAAIKELNLSAEKVNVNGGACVLGHPIGASGARILVTLVHALINRGGKRGVASLCLGGGEATAIAIEIP